jgi:AcrR family transcriptional regulator
VRQGGLRSPRGYHETNISHICEAMGIARGTLYQHFTSKKDVFAAIVEEMLGRVREAVAREPVVQIPPGFRPTRDQVLQFTAASLQRVLEAVFADAASLRILVREAVGLDVGIDAILHSIDELVIDRFASDLEVARAPGSSAPTSIPGPQRSSCWAACRRWRSTRWARDDGAIDLGALALRVTRMNMLGLLAEEVHR